MTTLFVRVPSPLPGVVSGLIRDGGAERTDVVGDLSRVRFTPSLAVNI